MTVLAGAVDLVAPRLPALRPAEARHSWDAGATVIDLRTAGERSRDGDLPGALRVSPEQVAELDLSTETTVILVCAAGDRSGRLAGVLHRRGFGNVTWVGGGYRAWLEAVWRQWSELLVCEPGTPASRFTRLISLPAAAPAHSPGSRAAGRGAG